MKYKKLFQCIHGSHLYGLDTPQSDTDYKGVFMPELDELLLGKSPRQVSESSGNNETKNSSDDIDSDWYSLPEFIKLACQGETIALDMLHAHTNREMVLCGSPEWAFIVANKDRFYTKNMKAFLGYAKKQAAKYGLKGSRMGALEEVWNVSRQHILSEPRKLLSIWDKLPVNDHCRFINDKLKSGEEQEFYEVLGSKYQNSMPLHQFIASMDVKWSSYGERARQAKDNEGIDWKAVSHAIRAAYQLKEIYLNGCIEYPLKDRDVIRGIKIGDYDFLSFVQPLLESLIAEVEGLADKSPYPDKVDTGFWDDWLISVYRG